MTKVLLRLNDPETEGLQWHVIGEAITEDLFQEMQDGFGISGEYRDVRNKLSKVLGRFQSAFRNSQTPLPSPQKIEMERLKKAVDRAILAFDKLSDENKSEIDSEILYRDPFNRKFFFPEQVDYWKKNEASTKTAINKLQQVSHALKVIQRKRERDKADWKPTKNTPLDHLIQDLAFDFEDGSDRNASQHCYYDARSGNYAGQFFEFVKFILDRFAPGSYHSEGALGKRIQRSLALLA